MYPTRRAMSADIYIYICNYIYIYWHARFGRLPSLKVIKSLPLTTTVRVKKSEVRLIRFCTECQECSSQLCPVDCKYSDWAEWTDCFPYCKGTINRTAGYLQSAQFPDEYVFDWFSGFYVSHLRVSTFRAVGLTRVPVQDADHHTAACQRRGGLWQHRRGAELHQRVRGLPLGARGVWLSRFFGFVVSMVRWARTCRGKWGSWVAWSECPVSCGGATQTRARDVLVQKAGGGKACEGAGE